MAAIPANFSNEIVALVVVEAIIDDMLSPHFYFAGQPAPTGKFFTAAGQFEWLRLCRRGNGPKLHQQARIVVVPPKFGNFAAGHTENLDAMNRYFPACRR
jgi:hypothetical protein